MDDDSHSKSVIFILADSTRLKVNVNILTTSSPVFSAMFGPNWKGGRELSDREDDDKKTSPLQVDLPADEPAVVRLAVRLCVQLLDGEDVVKYVRPPEPSMLLELAVFVDKYIMTATLMGVSGAWLKELLDAMPESSLVDDYVVLLEAAYLFNNALAFHTISKAIVVYTVAELPDCGNTTNALQCAYARITAQRTFQKASILHTAHGIRDVEEVEIEFRTTHALGRYCRESSVCRSMAQRMRKPALVPRDTSAMSVMELKAWVVEKLAVPTPEPSEEECKKCMMMLKKLIEEFRRVWEMGGRLIERAARPVKGVCLECVKAGGRNEAKCLIEEQDHFEG